MAYERPSEFVMEDGATLGTGVKVAKSQYKTQERAIQEMTAIAVRDYGTAKRGKIVRFMYSMRSP